MQTFSSHVLHIDPKRFSFRSKGYASNILEDAYDRFALAMSMRFAMVDEYANAKTRELPAGTRI